MKNKITILIVTSVLALIALSSIQGYLISNTYELEKRAFIKETDDAISKIGGTRQLDSLYAMLGEDLKDHLADYKSKRISKSEVMERLKKRGDELNKSYMRFFNANLKKINLGYEVSYKMNINNIMVIENETNDTIYSSNRDKEFRLFGNDFDITNANTINISRWFSEHDFIREDGDSIEAITFGLEVKTQNYILIKDWKRIVFGRMATLLIASVLIFLFVIGLLYYSIKNLITQKKITEIKTDFINNITHELKTPLATLGIATKSLKTEKVKNNPVAFENTLNIADRQNDRLQKLIDQVLTNSLSSEDIVLSKDRVVDNTYFTNLIEDFKLGSQRTDLQIVNQVSTEEIILRIDTFHFTTAIQNILENAVKYGKEKTVITFQTELKNGDYTISISDNGIGVSEKNRAFIFDKFYRVNDGNVHDVKGLGLGLYYTSQIVKAHNGTIKLESELNKGTTFLIKIPIN